MHRRIDKWCTRPFIGIPRRPAGLEINA